MTSPETNMPCVAIACGGTGGHLFPGLAVAAELQKRGCQIALLISPKEIDQQAVKTALECRPPARRDSVGVPVSACSNATLKRELQPAGPEAGAPMEIFTLPAVGLQNRNYFSFASSFVKSLFAARNIFRQRRPDAVLAMGGFTSAPPIWVGKNLGAKTFLHESNTIPGRANRILSRFVDEAFVGFPEAAARLKTRNVTTTGTPVRAEFRWGEAADEPAREDARPTRIASCRTALGLEPNRPTILVVGGSQGASGLNEMILSALPRLAEHGRLARELKGGGEHAGGPSALQFLHLTGASDFEKVKAAYVARGIKAVVKPFLAEMDLALGAATVAVSRAGASSLAEIAAMRLPSLLVPFPAAADNHQVFNASAFEKTGAAMLLEQKNSTPEKVAAILTKLVEDETARSKMQSALAQWHAPRAAEQIAEIMLAAIARHPETAAAKKSGCGCGCAHDHAKHATS
jgi:UDP-N-acetylglucosamine--N-acetylmuramyl-(pentapeptide) pyrophosphoryl-undecaprenol N-acetylglucosamine transferase